MAIMFNGKHKADFAQIMNTIAEEKKSRKEQQILLKAHVFIFAIQIL